MNVTSNQRVTPKPSKTRKRKRRKREQPIRLAKKRVKYRECSESENDCDEELTAETESSNREEIENGNQPLIPNIIVTECSDNDESDENSDSSNSTIRDDSDIPPMQKQPTKDETENENQLVIPIITECSEKEQETKQKAKTNKLDVQKTGSKVTKPEQESKREPTKEQSGNECLERVSHKNIKGDHTELEIPQQNLGMLAQIQALANSEDVNTLIALEEKVLRQLFAPIESDEIVPTCLY